MKLSEAIEALCLATRAEGRSQRTVGSYRQKLKPLLEYLGDVDVATITVHDLRGYLAYLADRTTRYPNHPQHEEKEGGLSRATIHSRYRHMKRLFNWLVEEGELEESPARRITMPRPKREEPKGISSEDFWRLIQETDGDRPIDKRDKAIMHFLFDTGCRAGGLCGLRIQDLALDQCLATVTEKRGKTRKVPFLPVTRNVLQEWLDVRPTDRGDWVFVGLGIHSKGAMTASSVLQTIRRRAIAAGIEGPYNPHAFRHGFARHFLMHGGDLGTLSDLMGHANVTTTKSWYAIFTVSELQAKHREHSPLAEIARNGQA